MLFNNDQKCLDKPVLILAGGTGGHVYPGLAVADELLAMNNQVAWLGNHSLVEQTALKSYHQINYYTIKMTGIRGKRLMKKLYLLLALVPILIKTLCLLMKIRPGCVLSMGGFVSGPAGLIAKILGLRLIIHEQNSVPGLTNKVLSKWANKILTGFPNCFASLEKATFIGNPVRKELIQLRDNKINSRSSTNTLRLLILGGSQGAKRINEILVQTLRLFDKAVCPETWHQTGDANFLTVKKQYEVNRLPGKCTAYIENMEEAYAWADIVLCRAGAMTIAELTCVGLAAILVPYPHAVDDHQTANAHYLVSNSAGLMIQETALTPQWLKDTLIDFIHHPDKLADMAKCSAKLANLNAANAVARACL